jgi:uncharacterized protein YcfJ
MNKFLIPSLLLLALIFSTGCQNNPNRGRDIGILAGAILGGVAGAQMGDGADINIAAGAVLGGALGGMAGDQLDKRKEALEAAEAQRQYEYEQEVVEQEKLEDENRAIAEVSEQISDLPAEKRKVIKEDIVV